MREIVKLINKKDLEEIIELELKINNFYKYSNLFSVALLVDGCVFLHIKNEEIRKKLGTNYINNFIFYIDLNYATIDTNFTSYNEAINIQKTIELEKHCTSKDIAKYIEQIIDEYNKEQDYITFVWGDEE
ncbi:hypothetical protein AVBRAN12640_06315 [Campylobacter sp. RM12640]|uniref:hypothetical protein n=1 Tax=unclassified Campylobacter TaxID=2593542 RepID=UPI001DB9CFED|nr:hypothetical protein [Campylobacter sp. RM12637]MBZ7982149.1 hypothetical protein [Campylobacter sp. RM12640]MBZ7983633.1 hypothetical protein [Campylobacter sp. RM12647]MBZ7989772.1 hypothetical protein [Campylobacter sp. RM12635]